MIRSLTLALICLLFAQPTHANYLNDVRKTLEASFPYHVTCSMFHKDQDIRSKHKRLADSAFGILWGRADSWGYESPNYQEEREKKYREETLKIFMNLRTKGFNDASIQSKLAPCAAGDSGARDLFISRLKPKQR